MSERLDRFKHAFNAIHEKLQTKFPDAPHDFSRLVDRAARRHQLIDRHRDDLKAYARLRNVVEHRATGRPLAEPLGSTVATLERILALLVNPPRIKDYACSGVVTCVNNDRISAVLRKIRADSLSQVPVVVNEAPIDMLTANTITRWMASGAEDDGVLLDDEPVETVLAHKEEFETWVTRPANTEVERVLNLFSDAAARGMMMSALLITVDGSPRTSLQQIVTVADLPRLHRALQPCSRGRPRPPLSDRPRACRSNPAQSALDEAWRSVRPCWASRL